jgi:hypothetical protein
MVLNLTQEREWYLFNELKGVSDAVGTYNPDLAHISEMWVHKIFQLNLSGQWSRSIFKVQ